MGNPHLCATIQSRMNSADVSDYNTKKEVKVEIQQTSGELAMATITTTKTINGEEVTDIQKIEGTVAEIEQKAKEAGKIVSVNVVKDTKEITEKVEVIVEKKE